MKRPDNGKLDEPISRRGLLKIGVITTAALLVPGCAQPAPSVPAPMATSTNLLQAAKDVITDFNAPNYKSLERRMDNKVILKRILKHGSYDTLPNVKLGLENDMSYRNPKLKNSQNVDWDGSLLNVVTKDSDQETYGRVSGSGFYIDDKGTTKVDITFTFDFERNSTSDGWLLINCYGAPS
jgi:hypothetical protein